MQRFQTRSLEVFLRLQERWNKHKNHPLTWLGIFVLVAVAAGLLFVNPVWAQTTPAATDAVSENLVKRFAGWIAGIVIEYVVPAVTQVFLLIISIVITIMQYNSFSTSTVVGTGWVIVRDIMNIFFVMVLIVIAMGTIFGGGKFKWTQQVPRLMLFALLINFSRTICGIMIDFGQVIMLTFANALKDLASGNFIQLFGIMDFYQYSQTGVSAATTSKYELLLVALMTLFVMLAVTITMGIFVMILIYRIVMLWILVVLSPLAFFLGGARDLFGQEGYIKWWTQFKCAVVIGPVLAFFLWLTLSVAGSGSVSITEGLTTASTSTDNPSDMLTKIFEKGNFISLLIGLGMMYAGFDAASSFCGSEAMFSGMIGRAKGAVGTAAKWTAGGAAGLAILGTRQGAKAVSSVGTGVGKAAAGAGSAALIGGTAGLVASNSGLARVTGKLLRTPTAQGRAEVARDLAGSKNKTVARLAGGYADTLDKRVAADYVEAGKGMEGASRQTKLDYLDSVARGGKPTLPGEQKRAAMAFSQAMGDPKALEQLEKKGQLKSLYDMFGKDLERISGGDDKMADRLGAFEESRPDLTGDTDKIDASNIGKLGLGAFAAKSVSDSLRGRPAPVGSKANDLYEHVAQGYLGPAKQAALLEGESGMFKKMSGEELAQLAPERIADKIDVTMVEKSPGMVANVMNSTNPQVQQAVRGLDPSVLDRMMRAHAGISATGQVEDADKFKSAISANPSLVSTFTPAMMSGGASKAIAENFGVKEWQKASAQIQKNPDENVELRMNLAQASDEAAQGEDYNDQSVKAAAMFDQQMSAMDARETAEIERRTSATEIVNTAAAQEQITQITKKLRSDSTAFDQAREKMLAAQGRSRAAVEANDYVKATKFDDIAHKYELQSENLAAKIAEANRKIEALEGNA
ncbi:hypothetical protein KJ611_03735 [Patescibacteria group bacterium]|nr:hypothetical protein [Patescibacteria group bacterium]MBU1705732.1 hypothetical protein [Patescibacteria group bacterium]